MPDGVEEALSFDISGALQGIGSISDALDQVVQTFQVGLADALSTLTNVGADVTPLADSLDVTGLGPAVETALTDATAAPLDVTVEPDTAPLVDGIDAAIVPQTVPVEADTTSANQAIDGLDSTPITLEVDADTSSAADQIDQLGQSATSAVGGGGVGGGEGVAGLEGAVVGLKAGLGAARGEVDGATEAVGGLSAGFGVAVGGITAFGAFVGETTKLAADAEAQNKRFAATFGLLAEQVDQIHVGGLNTTIEELGKASGTTDADLKAVASRIGALGQSAGASSSTIVKTTDNLLALGATFSVNNPRLGDAASVTDRLTNAFARGGRALAPFGLALSAAQINAEALAETGKSSAADLTLFEKSTAGANLAVKIFGDTLGTKFQAGAQSAQVQFRALKVSLEETLVAVGTPLLQPLVDSFSSVLPVAQEVGIALGNLARVVLPAVGAGAQFIGLIVAPLKLVSDGLGAVGDAIEHVPEPLLIGIAGGILAIGAAVGALDGVIAAFLALDAPILLVVGALAGLGAIVDSFGNHAKLAAVDTSALDAAFASADGATQSLTASFAGLTSEVDKYLKKQLAVKAGGQTELTTLNQAGVSFDAVSAAIQGTSATYDALVERIKHARDVQVEATRAQTQAGNAIGSDAFKREQGKKAIDEQTESYRNLLNTLDKGRTKLEDNAHLTLDSAVATGTLTDKQLKAAVAAATAGGKQADYLAILKQLAPTIETAEAAQAVAARTAADSGGAFAHLSGQIKQLGADQIDAATTAKQLGISVEDAKKFIIAESDAFLHNADAAILASAAGRRLTDDLQTGTISANQARIGFAQLGVSIPGVTEAITNAQKAVSAFVDSSLSKLPTVADAFKDATTKSKVNLDTFETQLQQKILNIVGFTNSLTTLVGEGFGNLAGFLASQGPQVAGEAAAALATDANKAKILDSTIGLFGGAQFAAAIKLRHLFPGLSEQAVAEATGAFAAAQPPVVAKAGQTGTAAGQALVTQLAEAGVVSLEGNTSLPAAAKKKGDETGAKFNPDLTKGTQKGVDGAAKVLLGAAVSLTFAAHDVGHGIGESFDAGFAQGISANTPVIASAATAAANAAERAAKEALKSKSPSLVAKQIGSDFTTGLALGIVDQAPQAADASTVLANAVVKQLQAALAAATSSSTSAAQTAAQSAFTSFVSGAVNSLPTVGSDISTFASNILSTTQAQNAAFKDYKKALAEQRGDQGTVQKLQTQTAAAYGTLTVAMQHYNALAASEPKKATDAQKKALAEAKSALSDAQSTFDSLARHLDSANSKLKDAAANLAHVEDVFGKATAAQDKANDPATFTKGLRAQTAAANQFARDIAKLSREGFTDLAKQLADAGPDAAGELARGFAKSPAKAKSAEAAVDAAGTFATSYQAELARLFSPQGGAADAAHTAGTTIGQALTTGLQVSSQAGTAAALANLSAQIAGAQVLPLVTTPQVQKALTPVAANAPTVIQTPTLAGQVGSQSLELDLTIVLDDGRTVTAQTSVPFIPAPTRSLKQLVRAQVHAS